MEQSQQSQSLSYHYGRLMRRTPMLRPVLALAAGILLAEYLPAVPLAWLAAAVGAGIVLIIGALYWRWPAAFSYIGLCLSVAAFGWCLSLLRAPSDPFAGATDEWLDFSVTIKDTPRPTPKCYKAVAEVGALRVGDSIVPVRGRVMLYLRQDSLSARLRYGDRIWIHARPELPPARTDASQPDFRRILRHRGILRQCYAASGQWRQIPSDAPPRGLAAFSKRCQESLVQRIRRCDLTPAQQGIAEALLLGWRNDVDEATQLQFRAAGITHLLCVSGLHVGIVAWLAGCCLFFLGCRRWQRVLKGLLQVAVVWAFVLLTGMAPSTLRAGVMITLLLLEGMAEQRPNTLNNLCTSAALLLIANPLMLFDAGFELSYAAVLGIVLWQRPLQELIPALSQPMPGVWLWLPRQVWQLVCLSTSAQLATLPFALCYFHQFPVYFLIANVTVVPFAALLLGTVMVMLLTGGWAAGLLRVELVAVDRLTSWIASLPSAMLEGLSCDIPVLLILIAELFLLTLLLRCRQRWALPAIVLLLIILALYV